MRTTYQFILDAAVQSQHDGTLWFRYLRKIINASGTALSKKDISKIIKAKELNGFQKATLLDALNKNTEVHKYIIKLNEPAKGLDWKQFMGRTKDDK